MTTPVKSGTYVNTGGYADLLVAFFPIAALLWANIGNAISEAAKEDNEDKLENILKRIGYRPVVEVYRSFIVMAISMVVFFTPAMLLLLLLVL